MRHLKLLLLFGILSGFLGAQEEKKVSLRRLASKCGREIKWVRSFKKAQKRAQKEGRLIFVYLPSIQGRHMYKRSFLDEYMQKGPFVDEDVIELINRKFIPYKDSSGGRRFRLKALAFVEPGIIFLTPQGELVHRLQRIRTFSSEFILWIMLNVLKKNNKFNKPSRYLRELEERLKKSPDDINAKFLLAKECIKDGDYKRAEALLKELMLSKAEGKAKIFYALATILRRFRKMKDALGFLEKARKIAQRDLVGDLLIEEALLHLKAKKFTRAEKLYKEVIGKYKNAERLSEAKYLLGVIRYLSRDEEGAFRIWNGLVKTHPSSRWAWKASANLLKAKDTTKGIGGFTHAMEDLFWLSEELYKHLLQDTQWIRKKEDLGNIIKRAVGFLLMHQRSDGSWRDSRYTWSGPQILPNVWVAVSSLCAAALLEWKKIAPRSIEKALLKAQEYILNEHNMARGVDEECYADCYRLLYLAKRANLAQIKEKKDLLKHINRIIKRLRSQQRGGFWAHEYPNGFTTATVIHSLHLAQKIGAKVPKKMIKRARRALLSIRARNGTYAYGAVGKGAPIKASAGRMPLCEMALFFAGKSDVRKVKKALNKFLKYQKLLERVRKCDFHADPYGNGGFFFFHNLYPATEAVKLLPSKDQGKYFAKFLEILVKIPEIDGSFIDDHEVGKCYATAMALLCLKNCVKELP